MEFIQAIDQIESFVLLLPLHFLTVISSQSKSHKRLCLRQALRTVNHV